MSPGPPLNPAPPADPPAPGGHAWDGGVRRWDAYYGIILVGVLVLVIAVAAQQDRPAADLAVSCAALAAMAPWYALNRRILHYGQGSLARGLIYLAGLWILFIVASSQGYIETWVLLALGPQCFLAVPFRWAVGAVVVLNLTPVALALISGAGSGELTTLVGSAVLTAAFSVAFGLWVFRIIAQSYDRASLISELGQTRAELAQANREGRRAGRTAAAVRGDPRHRGPGVHQHHHAAPGGGRGCAAGAGRGPRASRAGPADRPGEPGRGQGPGGRAGPGRPGAGRARRRAAQADRRRARAAGAAGQLRGDRPGRAAAQAAPRSCCSGSARRRWPTCASTPGPGRCRSACATATGQVGLEITDDGVGFDPGQPGGGYGLPGMRARAAEAGGRLEVRSSPGGGTTVSVVVPVGCPRRPGGDAVSTVAFPAGSGPVRVLVADDHPVVRAGLRALLSAEPGLAVVAEAGSGEETVLMARQHQPDVVLMDLRMPGAGGLAAIRQLSADQPGVRVVVLTTYDSDADILPAVEAGAAGYLLKDTPRDTLVGAIFAAARGETVLAPSVAGRLVNRLRAAPAQAPAARETLSARETEVLTLAGRGLTNAQIGRELFVSEATVKTHLLRAYAKLGVSGRTAAVTRAMELGVLPSPGRP